MPIEKMLRGARAPFGDGIDLSGPEGLEAMSVSCAMSSASPETFRASVMAPTFGDTMVTRTFAQNLRATRTESMVDDMYEDYVQIAFVLAGATRSQQGNTQRITKAGEMTALFTGATFDSEFSPVADVIQFYLPLELLREHRFSPHEVSAHQWTVTPTVLAMQRFLTTITATPKAVAPAAAPSVGRAITEMGLAVLYEQRGELPSQDAREAIRIRALDFIAQHFHDPEVGVDDVAVNVGASPRYVQGLFSEHGTSVGRTIREARLRHAAGLLNRQQPPTLSVTEIARASGFNGSEHLSRAFKKVYGMTPRDFRAHAGRRSTGRR